MDKDTELGMLSVIITMIVLYLSILLNATTSLVSNNRDKSGREHI